VNFSWEMCCDWGFLKLMNMLCNFMSCVCFITWLFNLHNIVYITLCVKCCRSVVKWFSLKGNICDPVFLLIYFVKFKKDCHPLGRYYYLNVVSLIFIYFYNYNVLSLLSSCINQNFNKKWIFGVGLIICPLVLFLNVQWKFYKHKFLFKTVDILLFQFYN
jgi:hypothetical protein